MRSAAVALAAMAVAVFPAAGRHATAQAAAPETAGLCPWRVTSTMISGDAVAAVSAKDIWAASGSFSGHAKIMHWNGVAWTSAPTPKAAPLAVDVFLSSVLAISAKNVWAFGTWQTFNEAQGEGPEHTLVEHWNGSKWQLAHSPNPGTGNDELTGAAAVSARDIWAVGSRQQGAGPTRTLIEHWNGARWRIVPSPDPGTAKTSSVLDAVAVGSAKKAWAVGGDSLSGGRALALLWNGARWSVSKAGNPQQGSPVLSSVTDTSADSALTVGTISGPGKDQIRTLAEQWTGSAWSIVPSPTPAGGARLYAVAARNRDYAWAVGSIGFPWNKALAEHWNGRTWTQVPAPSPSPIDNLLSAVTAIPDHGGFLAIGGAGPGGLLEQNC